MRVHGGRTLTAPATNWHADEVKLQLSLTGEVGLQGPPQTHKQKQLENGTPPTKHNGVFAKKHFSGAGPGLIRKSISLDPVLKQSMCAAVRPNSSAQGPLTCMQVPCSPRNSPRAIERRDELRGRGATLLYQKSGWLRRPGCRPTQ